MVAADLIPSLEGMELGAYGKVGPPHGGGPRKAGSWAWWSFGDIILETKTVAPGLSSYHPIGVHFSETC